MEPIDIIIDFIRATFEVIMEFLHAISPAKFLEYMYENFSKFAALGIMFLLKQTYFRIWSKVKFYISIKASKETEVKKAQIQKICDNLQYHFKASRVLYIMTHNGTTSYTNMHLNKLTCICEATAPGISKIQCTISDVLMNNFQEYVDYFIAHKVMVINSLDHLPDDDNGLKESFQNNGVRSFFVVMVARKDFAIGFIRVEFCHTENHAPEAIDLLIDQLNYESKRIYRIVKP